MKTSVPSRASLQFGYLRFRLSAVEGFAFIPYAAHVKAALSRGSLLLARPFYLRGLGRERDFLLPKIIDGQLYRSVGYRRSRSSVEPLGDSSALGIWREELGLSPPQGLADLGMVDFPADAITDTIGVQEYCAEFPNHINDRIRQLEDRFLCPVSLTGSLLLRKGQGFEESHDLDVVVDLPLQQAAGVLSYLDRQERAVEFGRTWPTRFLSEGRIVCPFFRRPVEYWHGERLKELGGSARPTSSAIVEVETDDESLYVPAKAGCIWDGQEANVLIHSTLGAGALRRGRRYELRQPLVTQSRGGKATLHVLQPLSQMVQL